MVVLGKWEADPEPDNPQSGLRVPRNGYNNERERERERASENARSFSWVLWLLGLTCEWYQLCLKRGRERDGEEWKSRGFLLLLLLFAR